MNFLKFFTRLEETIIQEIIGQKSIATLNLIDNDLSRLENLQNIILNIYTPFELLSTKRIRNLFIDLLKPAEIAILLDQLGFNTISNHYETIKKVDFSKKHNMVTLLNFFDLELPPPEENIEPNFQEKIDPKYKLFKHQRKAIIDIHNIYNNIDGDKALLHMPTGSGKTRTAMSYICDHLRKNEPSIVMWFCNTEELCQQAYNEFKKSWNLLGNRQLDVMKYWGSSKEKPDDMLDGLIVAGLSKTYSLLLRDMGQLGALSIRVSLVIMDEAHMAIAPTYKTILKILTSNNALLLGLSATPGRTWNDINADRELANFFANKKVTINVDGYTNPITYLEDKGYLAKIKNSPLLYDSGLELSEKDIDYLKDYLQLPKEVLITISEDVQRNIRIIQKIRELVTRHNRIIMFAITVDHSDLLATILQALKIEAYSLTSKTDTYQRKKIIDLYKSNKNNPIILCNYGILTTGFDSPNTSCAVISRPTDSLVLYSQMVGRAIRGVKAGGNKEAEIITVVDTSLPGFDEVTNAFFNWEDVWE